MLLDWVLKQINVMYSHSNKNKQKTTKTVTVV